LKVGLHGRCQWMSASARRRASGHHGSIGPTGRQSRLVRVAQLDRGGGLLGGEGSDYAYHAVPSDKGDQALGAPTIGAGGALWDHQVPDIGATVVHPDLYVG